MRWAATLITTVGYATTVPIAFAAGGFNPRMFLAHRMQNYKVPATEAEDLVPDEAKGKMS